MIQMTASTIIIIILTLIILIDLIDRCHYKKEDKVAHQQLVRWGSNFQPLRWKTMAFTAELNLVWQLTKKIRTHACLLSTIVTHSYHATTNELSKPGKQQEKLWT